MPKTTRKTAAKSAAKPTAKVIPFPVPPGTGKRLAAAAGQRWFIGTDCSYHRYLVPASKRADWEAFCAIPEEDERSWNVPEYAIRIEGETLEFSAPTLDGKPVTTAKSLEGGAA